MEGTWIKYSALTVLVLHNSLIVLFMRSSRTSHTAEEEYSPKSAVLIGETFKLITCSFIITFQNGFTNTFSILKFECLDNPKLFILTMLPALLYNFQNLLAFFAIDLLPSAIFHVTSQLKLLTSAIFAYILIGKTFTLLQIFALLGIVLGVVLVEFSQHDSAQFFLENSEQVLGFFLTLLVALSSGFSGIIYEKALKSTTQKKSPAPQESLLWIRNIQLTIWGFFFAFLTKISDEDKRPLFYGFDSISWIVVFLQSFGGILTSVVVNYAGTMLKGVASSLSLVLSSFLAVFLLNFEITLQFAIGTTLVSIFALIYTNSGHVVIEKDKKE